MNPSGSISHDHKCIACSTEWHCTDNQCSFSDDLREGIKHENPIGTTCQQCRDAKVRKQVTEPKPEPLPTRPSNAAMNETGEVIKRVNEILHYRSGDIKTIEDMDVQEWVNQFHIYRITYQHLSRIGDMLHERKIIARLKTEREYHHTKKPRDKDLVKKASNQKPRGLSKEEKLIRNFMNLSMSEEDARKQVAEILAKAKGLN